ncbi:restriction endonuclease subunit S [Antarcticimicrobium sediminis]|uniref:restriction endonuclease subunit S n=1 Tax=Antarcticimicrobium sediminis TaxID=2546227 RepID=UPI0019D31E4C|nr:restriction endonuclease subunit S [Antarcticimicrobium sediminis]
MEHLGAVSATVMGQAPAGKDCNKEGRGTPFVKAGEFGPSRPIIREWTTNPKKLAKSTDVLICVVGATCGKINLGADCAIGRSAAAIRPNTIKLDQFFLHYFLEGQVQRLRTGSLGSAQTVISKDMLAAVEIPLPPLEEQQRIVAVLDEAFEGLTRARAHAEANLQNARELFENSLIATFDQVVGSSDHMTLEDASTSFGRGRSRHRPRNAPFLYGGPYPFVQTGDIRNSDGTVSTFSQSYSEEGLAQSKLWPAGTICITIAANIAETAVLGFDACFPDSIIGMVSDPKITFPEYVEFMLRFFAADLKKQGKGSAQDNINLGTFERTEFPFPPQQEQQEIVERLSRLANETTLLSDDYSQKLQDLDDLRQSILQKAFAGELT